MGGLLGRGLPYRCRLGFKLYAAEYRDGALLGTGWVVLSSFPFSLTFFFYFSYYFLGSWLWLGLNDLRRWIRKGLV